MIIVLDSNAAIEIVLNREKGKEFSKIIETAEKVITSEFFRIEVVNVIRKYYQEKYIKKTDCGTMLELAEGLIDEFIPIKENYQEAFNESIRLNYTSYDMLYLTLARRTGAMLMTLDRPLNAIAKKEGIETAENEQYGNL